MGLLEARGRSSRPYSSEEINGMADYLSPKIEEMTDNCLPGLKGTITGFVTVLEEGGRGKGDLVIGQGDSPVIFAKVPDIMEPQPVLVEQSY